MTVVIKKFFILFLLFLFPTTAHAEGAGFGVSALLPENQRTNVSYFDLTVAPGMTQNLTIQLTNQTTQSKRIRITPVIGKTNNLGKIEYQQTNSKKNIAAWLSESQVISLTAQEKRNVTFSLAIPKNAADGTYLAAFQIAEQPVSTKSPGINNQFAYILGLKVTVGVSPAPNWQLHGIQKKKEQLLFSLENASQSFASHQHLSIQLKKNNAKSINFEQEISGAPFSPFQLAIPAENITEGVYQLSLKITGTSVTEIQKTYTVKKIQHTFTFREIDLRQQHRIGFLLLAGFLLLLLFSFKQKSKD